jgi:hypothetical protein
MDCERLIALIKASVEHKRPPAERVCAAGLLAQWNAEHKAAGGRDSKFDLASDMVAEGAPLNRGSSKRNKVGTPNEARGHIEYMNSRYAEMKAAHGGPYPPEQAMEIRRNLCNKFWTLPFAEQTKYDFLAKNKLGTDISLPEEPNDVPEYDRNRAGVLWGNSSLAHPINPDKAADLILKEFDVAEVGGFNQYQEALRRKLVERSAPPFCVSARCRRRRNDGQHLN